MSRKVTLLVLLSFLFLTSFASLVSAADSLAIEVYNITTSTVVAPGEPLYVYDAGGTPQHYRLQISIENDQVLGGVQLPFKFSSTDGATWTLDNQTSTFTGITNGSKFLVGVAGSRWMSGIYAGDGSCWDLGGTLLTDGLVPNQFMIGGAILMGAGLVAGPMQHMLDVYFTPGGVAEGETKHLCIDNTTYPPSGDFVFTDYGGVDVGAHFSGQLCHPVKYQPVAAPTISLSPASFTFSAVEGGSNPANQTLTITNTGGGTLNWTASDNVDWLTLDPTSGTGNGSTALSVSIAGLTVGTYNATVTVSDPEAGNTPQTVPVTLTISTPPPTISLSPTSFTFNAVQGGSNPATQVLNITNTGGGTMSWSVSDNAAWLSEAPTSGSGNGSTTLSVNISGLAANTYNATITVTATGATNTPQTVPVTLVVAPKPVHIVLNPTSFSFSATEGGSNPSNQTMVISNSGGGTLNWTASDDADWLAVAPASGTGNGSVTLSVNVTGLTSGTYNATVTVSDPAAENDPQTASVTLTIGGIPADLSVSPTSIDLGTICQGDPAGSSISIGNAGGGTISWSWTASEGIEPTTTSGTAVSGEAAEVVDFTVNTSALDYGTHNLEIVIDGGGVSHSPQTIHVTIKVANCGDCTADIAEVDVPQGYVAPIPVYGYKFSNVAGVQFHIEYNASVVSVDSVTSDYMNDATINIKSGTVHFIWDDIYHPVTVADGTPIMTLWVTAIGPVGVSTPLTWIGVNEIVDPLGDVNEGAGFCNGAVNIVKPTHNITGRIFYYDLATAIPEVTVDIAGTVSAQTMTDDVGIFEFVDLPLGNYTITPSRTYDDVGTSIADVVKIRRHLALLEEFTSPYQMIAADVNLSNAVSVADIVKIQRYLAMLEVLPSGNWIFIDSDFAIDMSNWFEAPRTKDVTIAMEDLSLTPFIGIRMGDVDGSWASSHSNPKVAASNSATLGLNGEVTPGAIIEVPISVANISELAGVEFHISYDKQALTLLGFTSEKMTEATTNTTSTQGHFVWSTSEPIDGSGTLVVVRFQVGNRVSSSSEISVVGEVADNDGTPYQVSGTLLLSPGVDPLPGKFALYQNHPNPFNPSTTIMFNLKTECDWTLSIYNMAGQKVRDFSGHGVGEQSVVWDAKDNGGATVATGIYVYKFKAADFVEAKKMVLMK